MIRDHADAVQAFVAAVRGDIRADRIVIQRLAGRALATMPPTAESDRPVWWKYADAARRGLVIKCVTGKITVTPLAAAAFQLERDPEVAHALADFEDAQTNPE